MKTVLPTASPDSESAYQSSGQPWREGKARGLAKASWPDSGATPLCHDTAVKQPHADGGERRFPETPRDGDRANNKSINPTGISGTPT